MKIEMETIYNVVTTVFEENGLDSRDIQGMSIANNRCVTIAVSNMSTELKDQLRKQIARFSGIKEENVMWI